MPELPSVVGDLVGEHQPDDRPPFDVLVRRRSRRRRTRAGLAILAVGLAVPAVVLPLALGGDDDEAVRLAGPSDELTLVDVTVADPGPPAQVEGCLAQHGAKTVLTLTDPPQLTLRHNGTVAQHEALEACLLQAPGARITGSVPAASVGSDTDRVTDFAISYGQAGVTYDAGRDEAALARCASLPGVGDVRVAESYPPQVTVSVTGTSRLVEQCLRSLPGASVRVVSAPSGGSADPDAPVSSPAAEPAGVRLAGAAPAPTDTTIALLVSERACTGGQSAAGRVDAAVDYGVSAVTVTVSVRSLVATDPDTVFGCPGNPETPYELVLDQPLGDRQLVLNGLAVPSS